MTVPAAASIDIDQLSGMKRKQLQSLCKKHGIKANAKTEELIEMLTEYAKNGGSSFEAAENEGDEQSDRDLDEDEDENEGKDEGEGEQEDKDDAVKEKYSDGQGKQEDSAADQAGDSQGSTAEKGVTEISAASLENEKEQKEPEHVSVLESPQVLDAKSAESAESAVAEASLTVSEQIAAEMQARVAALAADERKEVLEKYNAEKSMVPATPGKSKELLLPKSVSFDRVHSKIFDKDDSIANHWAAKKAPGAATPGGKRLCAEDVAPTSNKRARVEPLFASQTTKPAEQDKVDESADSAGSLAANDEEAAAAEAKDRHNLCDSGSVKESANDVQKASANENEQALEPQPARQVGAAISNDSTDSNILPAADALEAKEASPIDNSKAAVSLDPEAKSKKISTIPRPSSSSLHSSSSMAPKNKQPSKVPTKVPIAGAKPAGAAASSVQKPGYRNVESKIKSYIHAKLPSPKIKPVKHTVVDPKMPKSTAAPKPAVEPAKKPSLSDKKAVSGADGEKKVPNYMRPTRAAEGRAHKPAAVAPVKGSSESKIGKIRNKPYSRTGKPAAAVAAVAAEKLVDTKAQSKDASVPENP